VVALFLSIIVFLNILYTSVFWWATVGLERDRAIAQIRHKLANGEQGCIILTGLVPTGITVDVPNVLDLSPYSTTPMTDSIKAQGALNRIAPSVLLHYTGRKDAITIGVDSESVKAFRGTSPVGNLTDASNLYSLRYGSLVWTKDRRQINIYIESDTGPLRLVIDNASRIVDCSSGR
jgi:hypothetical protein